MVDKVTPIYQSCIACHGHGYWLIDWMKKDGKQAKRRRRYPCPRCKTIGIIRPVKNLTEKPDDDIPF